MALCQVLDLNPYESGLCLLLSAGFCMGKKTMLLGGTGFVPLLGVHVRIAHLAEFPTYQGLVAHGLKIPPITLLKKAP